MNLTSKEQVFGYVTAEIWNEFQHIHQDYKARLAIEIDDAGFKLILRWESNGQNKAVTERFTSVDMTHRGFYMTSWIRTFIAKTGINQHLPNTLRASTQE